jgi:hypothetical protein
MVENGIAQIYKMYRGLWGVKNDNYTYRPALQDMQNRQVLC